MTATKAMTTYTTVPSPLGELLLVGRGGALVGVYFPEHARGPVVAPGWVEDHVGLADARRQLDEYFAGDRQRFSLLLDPSGTPFQRQVWDALQAVPFGGTTTYGALAARIGRPRAARAIGAAVGRNPLSIVVPCHRVVGRGGLLTGYAGGMARKERLLALEGVLSGV